MFNIVLVNPEIPQNTGNIGRSVLAENCVLHLIKPFSFSLDDKYLKRAGLDYWKNVELKLWENIDDFFNSVPIEKMHLFSKRGSIRYDKASYKKGDFLIFGRETKGIPKEFLEKYSQRVRVLPMPGKLVRSLNLAVTAGVVLFEALRQNDFFENLE